MKIRRVVLTVVLLPVLLGLTARYLGLDKAIWMDILRATVPPKTVAINEKAFELGYAAKEMTF